MKSNCDISKKLDEFRSWLLSTDIYRFSRWDVLHLFEEGPVSTENWGENAVGPWARIWALDQSFRVKFSFLDRIRRGFLLKKISYVIVLYWPRVFLTSDFLTTLIHEYLHIHEVRGHLNTHPFAQEEEYESLAGKIVDMVRQESVYQEKFAPFFENMTEFIEKNTCVGLVGDETFEKVNGKNVFMQDALIYSTGIKR